MAVSRILVVDDNRANLMLLSTLLARKGYAVLTAADGIQARETIREQRPDLVLMDVQLPHVDGLQVTREIKADPALASIPIIAVTSFAMKGDREKALAAGCDGYITKPIDTRALPGEIARHLESRQPTPRAV